LGYGYKPCPRCGRLCPRVWGSITAAAARGRADAGPAGGGVRRRPQDDLRPRDQRAGAELRQPAAAGRRPRRQPGRLRDRFTSTEEKGRSSMRDPLSDPPGIVRPAEDLHALAKLVRAREKKSRKDQLDHARRQAADVLAARKLARRGQWG